MQKKIILLLCLFIFSCDLKKDAVGILNDLIVFTSFEDKELLAPIIHNYFDQKGAQCPQYEPLFNIRWKTANDLNEFYQHHNLLFLSIENPKDTTLDRYLNKMNEVVDNDNSLFSTKNLYAYNQVVSNIQAFDAIHFETILDSNFNWLFNQYESELEKLIWIPESEKMRNDSIIVQIQDWFSFEMPISMDYIEVKKDTVSKDFLWIGRVYPYRWITIHEFPLINKDASEIYWEIFESLILQTMPNIEISEFYRKQLISKKNKILKGVYGHTESNTGGPFICFIFENKELDQTLFVTGYVNNPGNSKILMLKELELIFEHSKTFTLND